MRRRRRPGLGAHLVGDLVPLRAADGAQQHGVGLERLVHGGVRDRLAVGVVGAAAHEVLLDGEVHALGVEPADDLLHLAHDLGADAVAGEDEKVMGHGARSAGWVARRA